MAAFSGADLHGKFKRIYASLFAKPPVKNGVGALVILPWVILRDHGLPKNLNDYVPEAGKIFSHGRYYFPYVVL